MPIAFQIMTIGQSITAANELFAVIDRASSIDPMHPNGLVASGDGHIQVRGVTFEYPSRRDVQVLNHMEIDIPANKTTAIVGASGELLLKKEPSPVFLEYKGLTDPRTGSGKSTIVGLLQRWYEQSEGSILLDGTDIRKLNVRWLRNNVRLVQVRSQTIACLVYNY